MKKKLAAVIISAMMVSLTACGSGSSTSSQSTSNTSAQSTSAAESVTETDNSSADHAATEETAKNADLDFDGSSQSDTGNGSFYLVTASGSTENGDPVVVYAGSDDILIQIEFDTSGINGGSLSYIYVDGMEKDKEQVSDSQVSLDLSEDDLSVGTHKVELVQFENDDPTGNVTTYKSAEYEVKAK